MQGQQGIFRNNLPANFSTYPATIEFIQGRPVYIADYLSNEVGLDNEHLMKLVEGQRGQDGGEVKIGISVSKSDPKDETSSLLQIAYSDEITSHTQLFIPNNKFAQISIKMHTGIPTIYCHFYNHTRQDLEIYIKAFFLDFCRTLFSKYGKVKTYTTFTDSKLKENHFTNSKHLVLNHNEAIIILESILKQLRTEKGVIETFMVNHRAWLINIDSRQIFSAPAHSIFTDNIEFYGITKSSQLLMTSNIRYEHGTVIEIYPKDFISLPTKGDQQLAIYQMLILLRNKHIDLTRIKLSILFPSEEYTTQTTAEDFINLLESH